MIEDVAEEFAIPFNTKTFERKISGAPPNKNVCFSELTGLHCPSFLLTIQMVIYL